jgi:hypothetical protein
MIDQSFDILVGEVGVRRFRDLTMFINSDRIGYSNLRERQFYDMLPVIEIL